MKKPACCTVPPLNPSVMTMDSVFIAVAWFANYWTTIFPDAWTSIYYGYVTLMLSEVAGRVYWRKNHPWPGYTINRSIPLDEVIKSWSCGESNPGPLPC
ncbi:uncharacterized protein BO72DRAFT_48895 [Aspergillus fijiensis CBS 313.89]|uniref:Uncharacterized protein n=1 Tax=Aspergillus fijiensis CBS 313.89 TaxID=1448319 RepID=A0A8G1RBR7_9EURO|nr:uncharacterized protein BO72DRAFT_48895 [Aspergillus fijiensis CBS 313.89]RAK70852.1 hypothetical protein BO72DRAFT_48895 [Aspergillus fijiensis CBS 313.89]